MEDDDIGLQELTDQLVAAGQPQVAEAGEFRVAETGEPRVDDALSGLQELAGLPVAEHPPLFERAHQRLREVLGELDGGPLTSAQGREGS